LNEAYKRGVYSASPGWFDLRRMTYLDDDESGRIENQKERGIDTYLLIPIYLVEDETLPTMSCQEALLPKFSW
jgi:hypothetical protein